jgi:hypothetical protein
LCLLPCACDSLCDLNLQGRCSTVADHRWPDFPHTCMRTGHQEASRFFERTCRPVPANLHVPAHARECPCALSLLVQELALVQGAVRVHLDAMPAWSETGYGLPAWSETGYGLPAWSETGYGLSAWSETGYGLPAWSVRGPFTGVPRAIGPCNQTKTVSASLPVDFARVRQPSPAYVSLLASPGYRMKTMFEPSPIARSSSPLSERGRGVETDSGEGQRQVMGL